MIDLEHEMDVEVNLAEQPLPAELTKTQMNILRARDRLYGENSTTPWCSFGNPFIWDPMDPYED